VPRSVIILGPNHHGIGARAALYAEGEWVTPLGKVIVNTHLAELVRKHAPLIQEDTTAHHYEHSLEVQLPFLQFVRPDVTIVPLCLGFSDFVSCAALGCGIAAAIGEYGDEVLIVASSDMTHYESAAVAAKKDALALAEVERLDGEKLLEVTRRHEVTMCGRVPAAAVLHAARLLGAAAAEVVHRSHSGMVTGDDDSVVSYAGVIAR
jgi:AmmeMemoRadiSam system protein B